MWNNCVGLDTAMVWAEGMNPAHPPGTWPPEPGGIGSESRIQARACERMSLGPFERPVRFILNTHTNETMPDSCRLGGKWDYFDALAAIYIDDPAVVNYARNELQMPAFYANMSYVYDKQPAAWTMTWSWAADGGERSDIQTSVAAPNIYPTDDPITYRYAWVSGGHVSLLDFKTSARQLGPPTTAVPGHVYSPMIEARQGSPYLGTGEISDGVDAQGTLHRFNDDQCKDPIDPWP